MRRTASVGHVEKVESAKTCHCEWEWEWEWERHTCALEGDDVLSALPAPAVPDGWTLSAT